MRVYSSYGLDLNDVKRFRRVCFYEMILKDGTKEKLDEVQGKEFMEDLDNILKTGVKNGSTEGKTEESGESGDKQESGNGSGGDIPA